MKTIIRSLFTAALALAAMFVTDSALAAVNPTAVFTDFTGADAEEGITVGGYTLKANGNTVAANGITISTTSGVTLEPTSGNGNNNVTVIVKYSGLTTTAVANPTILIANKVVTSDGSSTKSNNTGILLTANNSNKATIYYDGTIRTDSNLTLVGSTKQPIPAESGRFVYSYNAGGGTGMYFGENGGALDGSKDNGVKWSDCPLKSISIGSYRSEGSKPTNAQPATGMKIEKIAVIAGSSYLDASGMNELAAYEFPKFYVYSQGTASGWGGNCNYANDLNGITLPATDAAPAGTKVEVTKMEIAQSPSGSDDNNRPTRIAITVGGTTTTSADFVSSGTIAASGGNNPVKLTYTFPAGCVLTVGTQATIKWLKADGSEITSIRYAASNDAAGRFLSVNNGAGYSPIALLYGCEPELQTTPEVVALVNFRGTTGSAVEGWSDLDCTKDSGSDGANKGSVTIGDITVKVDGISGGNNFAQNSVSGDYETGTYTDIFGNSFNTVAEEVASSLNLGSVSFNTDVYKTGFHNGQGGHNCWLTISGLDSSAQYVAYLGFGLDGHTSGLNLAASDCGSVGSISYVTTVNGTNTSKATQYTEVSSPLGKDLKPGSNGLLMVRINELVAKNDGTVKIHLINSGGCNFVAIAKLPPPPGPTKATAVVNTDEQQTWTWGTLPWNVMPTKELDAEITVTGSKQLIIFPYDDTDATAKSITFKGSGSVDFTTTGLYDGGKITSEIPLVLGAAMAIDVDVGANDLTFSYTGFAIPPMLNLTCGGNLTLHGGNSSNPLSISKDFNKLTLAEDTYVKYDDKGTARLYDVTGAGATSVFTIARNGNGAPGFTDGSNKFNNVIVGSAATGNNFLWFEHTKPVSDTVGLKLTGNIKISDDTPNPVVVRSLTGNAKLDRNGSLGLSIKNLENADFAGTSTFGLTVLGSEFVQTFSGAYNQALTIGEGGKVKLTGNANPSSVTMAAGSWLSLDNGRTAASLTLNGNVTIEVASGTATISAISGNYAITKTGAGTLNLPAAYTQAVTLEQGLINATASNAVTITGDIDLAEIGSANLPLGWTLSATDNDGSLKLPANFPFGQIAKASDVPTGLIFKDSEGSQIAADNFAIVNDYIELKKTEIIIPYDVNGAVVVEGNLTFGTGGSINILNDGASLTVSGALELPAEGQLPISFALKGEYAQNTVFTLITASDGIKKGEDNAQLSDFALTVTMMEGMTGELQLSEDNTELRFVITSDTITADAAAVLNNGHLIRRFDANRGVTTGDNGKVTAWTDLCGTTAARAHTDGPATDQPMLVTGGIRNYLDFGVTGSDKDLMFDEVSTAKTVIEVIDIEQNENAFLLGHHGANNFNFHRGGSGAYGNGSHAKFSKVRDNGDEVANWSGTVIPTGFRVISLKLSQNCSANCFSQDRSEGSRNGGRKLCELLIFDAELSDSEFAAVEAYLTDKWALEYKNQATLATGDNRWSTLNWGAGKSYVPGSPIEITIGADNARLIYDDTTAPINSIVFVDGGHPYTTAYGADFGAKTIASGETMTIVGSTDPANPLVYAGALTVNGTLKTEGYVTLSNGSSTVGTSGTIEIVNNRTEMYLGDRKMAGTLTIDAGATFYPYGSVDGIKYDGNSPVVNVYGTLNMSDSSHGRWTLRSNITLNFYAGSTCTGAGQTSGNNHGALQFNNSADCVLNFLKKDGVGGTVDFSVVLHAQNAFTMNVEDGVTVNMSGSLGTGKSPFTLTGAGTINLTSAYDFNAPVTISAGTKLIIDGGSCAGGYTNNGTIELKSGTLNIGAVRDLSQWGTVIYEQGVISATATPAEYGEGKASFTNLPTSLTTLKFIVNGVEQSLPVSEGKATYSGPVVIDGTATWLDYTFTKDTYESRQSNQQYIENAGSAGTSVTLKYDGNYKANTSYNTENGALLGKSTPWRDMSGDTAWPSTYTAAVYANVPDVENGCLIGFGSSTAGNSYVVIVRGEDSNKIKLMRGTTTSVAASDIVEMSALNATSSKHLIVFTNSGGKFTVYCDGVRAAEIDAITLGGGFQVGSVHGGVPSNLVRVDEISDPTTKDAIEIGAVRVWDRLISQREMNALVEAFPYINKAGLFNRTIEAETANLSETDAWENNDTKETVDLPDPVVEDDVTYYPMINVETTAESTLTLNESLTVDTATFGGDEALTITAGGSGNTLTVGGSLTVNSPLKIKYGEVNITSVPLKLGEDGELEIDLANCGFDPAVVGRHQLTGLADEAEGKITIINEPTAQYFKGELVHEDGSYWFKVSADREATTLYLTASATLSDNTLYAMTADGEAIMPRLFENDVIYVKEGLTATMPATDLTIKAKFDGAGTIAVGEDNTDKARTRINGATPLFTVAEEWTGTVEFLCAEFYATNGSDVNTWVDLNTYGNASSKIVLVGGIGYFKNNVEFLSEVEVRNTGNRSWAGMEFTDGSSSVAIKFAKISGSGNITCGQGVGQKILVGDASGFTGRLTMSNNKGITFGGTDSAANNQIKVADGATITFANQEWVAAGGISFGATLNIIGAAGNYISMAAEPTSLPTTITVGGQPTTLMLKYDDGKLKLIQAAATVNGVKYETFDEALSAAITAGSGTAISIYETVENAEVEIPEDTNIIINGENTFSGAFVKTGLGTLTMNGTFVTGETTITVSEGTLVVTDTSIRSYGRPTTVAEGAVFEFNTTTTAPTTALQVYGVFTGTGTVRKAGSGYLDVSDADDQGTECVFKQFNGTVEVAAGTLYLYSGDLTINNCLKIDGTANVMANTTQTLLIGANAVIDLMDIDTSRQSVMFDGSVSVYGTTVYKFAADTLDTVFKFCNGSVMLNGSPLPAEGQILQNATIFIGNPAVENLATFIYEPVDPSGQVIGISYASPTPIIRITDTMTATELNAAIAAAGITTYATVYFDADATLELEENVTVNPILAVCEGDVNFAGTGSLGLYSIALNGETKTIDIAEGVTITPTKSTVLDNNMLANATITGAGTIVYDGAVPGNEKSSYQNANWTGTVWIKNYGSALLNFNDCANSASKVRLSGVHGWIYNSARTQTATLELVNDTYEYGLNIADGSSGQNNYVINKIIGDGTLVGSGSGGGDEGILIKDISGFTGNVKADTKCFTFGADGASCASSKIVVRPNFAATIAAERTWQASNIAIDGTIGGAGTLNGNVTFGTTAVIDASATQLTVAANKSVSFGNAMTVKLAAAPIENAPVKILNGSFSEQTFDTALTVMVGDQTIEGDFSIKQDANGVWAIVNAENIWTGAADADWDNVNNWSAGKVPTETSIVKFTGEGEAITVNIASGTRTIGSLVVDTSRNITINGALAVNGTITKSGTGELGINLAADYSKNITLNGGTLEITVPSGTTRTLGGLINGSGTNRTLVKSGEGMLKMSSGSFEIPNTLTIDIAEGTFEAGGGDRKFKGNIIVRNGATYNAMIKDFPNYDGSSRIDVYGTLHFGPSVRWTLTQNNVVNIYPGALITGDSTMDGGAHLNLHNANAKISFLTADGIEGTEAEISAVIGPGGNLTYGAVEVAEGLTLTLSGNGSSDNNRKKPIAKTGAGAIIVTGNMSGLDGFQVLAGTATFTGANTTVKTFTLGNGAIIPVTTKTITVQNTLTLPSAGTFTVDLGAASSGNFSIITAPNGYTWDTTKVALIGTYAEDDWNISGEGTTLVVSKLPLDAKIYEADGYNFGEKVIEVDVTTIDSTLTGTQIKVVTTDMTGTQVGDATLCPIDGSKGKYEVTIGGLTAGNAYNFNVTFVDSTGTQKIADSKEANLKNIAVGTLIKGVEVFSADASKEEGQREVGGEWIDVQTITDGKYVISDDVASVFDVDDAPTGNYTVEYDLSFEDGFVAELTAETDTPIAGLTIGEGATEGTFNWYRTDSSADDGWAKLDQTVEAGHYIIRMAFTATTVTYSVKGDEAENFTTLTQNTEISAFEITSSAISSVSFSGASALAKFGAKTDDTIDTTIANENIKTAEGVVAALNTDKTVTLKTNVAIDTTELAVGEYTIEGDFDLSFVGADTRSVKFANGKLTIANVTIINGESAKVNSDLNLDPAVATDKPFVKAINTTNPNAIAFKLFHGTEAKEVATDEAVNAKAKFYVESSTDATFTAGTVEKSPSAGVKDVLEVPLPTGESKVRYYRLKFD